MTTLTDFLLARIAEREAKARVAEACREDDLRSGVGQNAVGVFYDPAYVLADCEAKRRIVERCKYGDWTDPDTTSLLLEEHRADSDVLALLAIPDSSHADFQPEWHPDYRPPPPAPCTHEGTRRFRAAANVGTVWCWACGAVVEQSS